MYKYLNPKNDFAFKRLFGENKRLCISFLNSLLPLSQKEQIVDIEYNTGELFPEVQGLKNTIVDVRCTDSTGRQFLVEMQMYWSNSFKYRVLFNASKAYVRQIKQGEKYPALKPVYTLALIDQNYTDGEEFYHHYQIVEKENTHEQIPGLEFVFIELPKFKSRSFKDKKMQTLWLRFMTEVGDNLQVDEELYSIPEIHEAIDCVKTGAMSEEELREYDTYWDIIRTGMTIRDDFMQDGLRKGLELGRSEGRAEGIQEGIEQGIEKGIEQGIEKGAVKEKKQIARKLLESGMDFQQVAAMTGLEITQIKNLVLP